MKWNDRNIDQLFRDAAQNTPAPEYKSSYWNDVSSVLNAEQRRRRGLFLWSLGGGTVLAALFAILFYESTFQVDETRYAQEQGIDTSLQKHNNLKKLYLNAVNSNVSKDKIEKSTQAEVNLSRNKSSITADSKTNVESKIENTVSESSYSGNNQKTPGLAQVGNITTDNQTPIASQNTDKEKSKTKSKKVNGDEFTTSPEVLPVRELNFAPFKNPKKLVISNQRKWNLSAEVNLGAMENYKTSRPFESGIMSFALKGVYLKSNIQISSGIGVQVSTNSDLVVSQRAKYYGFGVVNHQTDISYQDMYDLYIPIEIGYHQNKTAFGMGLQANYLINTSMQLRKYEDNQLISSKNINGYNNGLSKFSTQGYLWISQQLSTRFSAGLKIGTNFTNRIMEGDYFNESATTNPIFGQVSLRYNIFK